MIQFRLFFQQFKFPLGTCNSHDHEIHLLRDLRDRLCEVTIQPKKSDDSSDGHAPASLQHQYGSDDCTEHIIQVTDIRIDRHQQVRIAVCFVTAVPQLIIQFLKIVNCMMFMTENLDYFLTIHHFFDETVHFSEITLLLLKIGGRQSGKYSCYLQHQYSHDQCDQGQRNVESNHGDQRCDQRGRGVNDLRNALTEQLTQCIYIIGIDRHDITVCMCIKVLDRKRLHIGEQLITKSQHRSLADIDHDTIVCIRTYDTDDIKYNDTGQCFCQRAKIRTAAVQHRHNVIIYQRLHEQHSLHGCKCSDHDADHNDQKGKFIIFDHIGQQAL